MKYTIIRTSQFKHDYKKALLRGIDVAKLKNIILMLANGEALPEIYKDHALVGKYQGYRECHIQSDLLLVYKISENELVLSLFRFGTHSDIF